MQGQLNSIGVVLGKLGEGRGDSALTNLADAIKKMSFSPSVSSRIGPDTYGTPDADQLRSMTNDQLRRYAVRVAKT